LGTSLNKILKDFIVKSHSMLGHYAPYVPGWDCHGLPIEIHVDKHLGEKKKGMPVTAVREECRKYAERFIDIQRNEFKRLGILGAWETPYLTMHPAYEAKVLEYLAAFFEHGEVYKGKRPVHWCIHDRTALAEAEIEYKDKTSPSIYVRFEVVSDLGTKFPALQGRRVFVVIWTTTPWTLPANLAIAFHPEYEYAAAGSTMTSTSWPSASCRSSLTSSAGPRPRSWRRSRAALSKASRPATRLSTAIHSSSWPTMSRSTTARAPSIRPPATATTIT
jgi:isoleucyl-tRNA synthetase